MTKQEWIKHIEILMLTGRDCFGGCEEYGCTDCQDKAKEVYEGIEQDLLKEFVGFVEDRLTIWIKDENYQANIAEAENDNLRKNMSLLMAETIEVIKNSMKPALKKFLEERK